MPMRDSLLFLYHKKTRGEVCAVFIDRKSGNNFSLTKEECLRRLKDLKDDFVPCGEIEEAVNSWPKFF